MDEHGNLRSEMTSGVADADRSFSILHGSGRRMAPQSPNEALQPEAAPPPPPAKPPSRRRPSLSALSGFLSFLVVVALAALGALAWGNNRLAEPGPLANNKVVYITPHTDLPDIIDKLNAEGVIDSPLAMNLVLTAERKRGKVKAGEFLFKQHASLRDVIDTLVSGKQFLHPITIPEGLTSQQIVQRLRGNDLLVGEVREVPKEGVLLPETYKVTRGMTRNDLLQKMEDDDRRLVEQIWARRSPDLPLRSPYDLVTLASIVEKETGKADERPRIAGVFMNRLRRHMRLQSDPTIVYGLVGGQGTLGHSITRSELDKKTNYNTYQIDGLPPGPIDNPGRAALEAVANPSRTPDLYFVADGTGGHAFAETIDEHNKNVQRWRELQREAKDKGGDVDKLSPAAVAPAGKGAQQRSEIDNAVFGNLAPKIRTASLGHLATFVDPDANNNIDGVIAADERGPAPETPTRHGRHRAPPPSMPSPATYATSLDTLGMSIADPTKPGPSLLDGPVTAPTDDAIAAPAKLASAQQESAKPDQAKTEQAAVNPIARTATAMNHLALPVARDAKAALDVAPGEHPDLFADPAGDARAPAVPAKVPPEHPKIYDASENTPLDPLRNKSYDLNSAKTIPIDLVH